MEDNSRKTRSIPDVEMPDDSYFEILDTVEDAIVASRRVEALVLAIESDCLNLCQLARVCSDIPAETVEHKVRIIQTFAGILADCRREGEEELTRIKTYIRNLNHPTR